MRGLAAARVRRRLRGELRGAQISSDLGSLVMRELNDAAGLSDLARKVARRQQELNDPTCGANHRRMLVIAQGADSAERYRLRHRATRRA